MMRLFVWIAEEVIRSRPLIQKAITPLRRFSGLNKEENKMILTYVRLGKDGWEAKMEGNKELFGYDWLPTTFTKESPLSLVMNQFEQRGLHVLVSQ